ncbi:MAG: hypothetical protein AAGE52_35100 [Myxococcota bacterium]
MGRSCVALLFVSSVAFADVLPPGYERPVCPDPNCPPGSTPVGGGHGACASSCSPGRRCINDAACGIPGATCVETAFCVDMQPMGRRYLEVVVGTPAEDGVCATGRLSSENRCRLPPLRLRTELETATMESATSSAGNETSMTGASNTAMDSNMDSNTAMTQSPSETSESSCSAAGASGGLWMLLLLGLRRFRA